MTRAEQEAKEIHYLALIEANRIAREQWDKGYKQAEKDTIKRACLWLKTHLYRMESVEEIDLFNELFKNAMEKE